MRSPGRQGLRVPLQPCKLLQQLATLQFWAYSLTNSLVVAVQVLELQKEEDLS